MASHKRLAPQSDSKFKRPQFECYACHDTGLLVNGDGLLRQYLPDYDTKPNGMPCGGHDLALVCWCKAAYRELGPDGQLVRGGFRDDSGEVRIVQTATGQQPLGTCLSKEATRELHAKRRQQWIDTETVMSEARASGEAPWFITESKVVLQQLPKPKQRQGGLQSLGSILSGTPDAA